MPRPTTIVKPTGLSLFCLSDARELKPSTTGRSLCQVGRTDWLDRWGAARTNAASLCALLCPALRAALAGRYFLSRYHAAVGPQRAGTLCTWATHVQTLPALLAQASSHCAALVAASCHHLSCTSGPPRRSL